MTREGDFELLRIIADRLDNESFEINKKWPRDLAEELRSIIRSLREEG